MTNNENKDFGDDFVGDEKFEEEYDEIQEDEVNNKSKKRNIMNVVLLIIFAVVMYFVFKNPFGGIEEGDRVMIVYEAVFENGEVFEAHKDYDKPLSIIVGKGNMLDKIEDEIIGMKEGEVKNIVVSPEEGYGKNYDPNKVKEISRLVFDGKRDFRLGGFYDLNGTKGVVKSIKKTDKGDIVVFDTNSLETWENIIYEVEIVDIE